MRGLLTAVVIAALAAGGAGARADATTAALADTLSRHVGRPLDLVELRTGKRFVRPTLVDVIERRGEVTGLKLRGEGETKTINVMLPGIAKIIAGRETVHDAEARDDGAARRRGGRARDAAERRAAAAQERMRENGAEPWPTLAAEEHAAQVAELERFVAETRALFPALTTTQTHEFIVATDIPAGQMAPFVKSLDAMHDFLCDLYGIPRGEPVWLGKCLVVAFRKEDDFIAFEGRFMREVPPRGAHGLCHQRSDGRVIVACHSGGDAPSFAHMLVHETSHGFNHRWMSTVRLPSWLNEGLAEWVGTQLVPACRQVPRKEATALEFMRTGGTLGPDFFADDPDAHIEAVQYGIASGLVRFLVTRDRRKFAAFVQGIKEGRPTEESLQAAFDASLDELVKAYGKAVGVPDLVR